MYEKHFGFVEKPFSILPDPRFLYFSRNHRVAYAMLEYGLLGQAGFTVVTGAIGSGKTTLVHRLIGNVPEEVTLGLISTASLSTGSLMEWILMSFGQPFEELSSPRLHRDFHTFLVSEAKKGRRVVLVIDEAQNLETQRLEELRMLSNLNIDSMLLQLVLIGQPELRQMLRAPGMRQFAQRISSDFHLLPLLKTDAVHYFARRIEVAGGEPSIFSRPAIMEIFDFARGIPRSINVLADRCLVYAFGDNVDKVGRRIVHNVIQDVRLHGIYSPEANPSEVSDLSPIADPSLEAVLPTLPDRTS